jgi:hypothetical protein
MRASLLMMARALRAGDTAVLDADALQAEGGAGGKSQVPQLVREGIAAANMPRGAIASHSAADEAAGVMPEHTGPQGPDWVVRQTTQQIDQLRRVLSTLPRLPT